MTTTSSSSNGHIDEGIIRLVRDEIERAGAGGTNITRIALALREHGVDLRVARDACKQLLATGEAERASPHGGEIHVRMSGGMSNGRSNVG